MEGRFRHQDVRSRTPAASPTSITSTASRPDGCWIHYANVRTVAGTATEAGASAMEALLRWAAMLHEVGLNINHAVCIATPLIFCKTVTCRVLIGTAADDGDTGALSP